MTENEKRLFDSRAVLWRQAWDSFNERRIYDGMELNMVRLSSLDFFEINSASRAAPSEMASENNIDIVKIII